MRDHDRIPTLRDIAAATGVSAITVSRILRNHPHHNPETAERVRRIAEEMGYRPNPLVSALMSQRVRQHGTRATANLAILDPRHDTPAANADYISGALRRARTQGYFAHVYPYVPAETPPARLREILTARAVRGIVMMPVAVGERRVDFDFAGFAAATIGYSVEIPKLPRVAIDGQSALFSALSRLESRGYRRVGLIMAVDASRRSLYLFSGARSTYGKFLTRGLKTSEMVLRDELFSPADRRRVVRWIARHQLQAVVSSAHQLFSMLQEEGFRIPGDLSYVHLHRHSSGIASMDQLRAHQGAVAVDIVTAMIQRNETLPMPYTNTIITRAVWRDGRTAPSLK